MSGFVKVALAVASACVALTVFGAQAASAEDSSGGWSYLEDTRSRMRYLDPVVECYGGTMYLDFQNFDVQVPAGARTRRVAMAYSASTGGFSPWFTY